MARKLGDGAALLAILLAIVAARVVWSSRVEWQAAQSATGAEQVAHLGRAARLYAPGNPYSRRAFAELAQLGRAADAGGDSATANAQALAAWRELRSAALATRSFYTPERALLAEANQRLAERMADADTLQPRERARAWHAARLAQDEAPSVAWTLVALAGLAAWIGCALGLILRGIGADDRLQRRAALGWALGLAAGLALFFVGLWRA